MQREGRKFLGGGQGRGEASQVGSLREEGARQVQRLEWRLLLIREWGRKPEGMQAQKFWLCLKSGENHQQHPPPPRILSKVIQNWILFGKDGWLWLPFRIHRDKFKVVVGSLWGVKGSFLTVPAWKIVVQIGGWSKALEPVLGTWLVPATVTYQVRSNHWEEK